MYAPRGLAPADERRSSSRPADLLLWPVRTYRQVESTRWGNLLLGNAWPAYLFTFLLAAKVMLVRQTLESQVVVADLHAGAALLQEMVTMVFLGLIVLLFAIRRPVLGRRAGWWPGLVALAGTFTLNGIGLLPASWDSPTSWLLASSAVVIVGTAFAIWSLACLGRCFGIFPEARGLVTRGPYGWVRHPLYLGEIVAGFGVVLARPHPAVFAVFAVFVGLQVWRAHYEEAALADAFPLEYPAYRARTGRLLPRWH